MPYTDGNRYHNGVLVIEGVDLEIYRSVTKDDLRKAADASNEPGVDVPYILAVDTAGLPYRKICELTDVVRVIAVEDEGGQMVVKYTVGANENLIIRPVADVTSTAWATPGTDRPSHVLLIRIGTSRI